jgi:uncharacterized membrane protein YjdF
MSVNAPPVTVRAAVRRHRDVAVVAGLAWIGFIAYGTIAGRPGTLLYAGSVLLLGVTVAFVDSRVGFSDGVLWGLALWAVLHMAGGLIPAGRGVLYNAKVGFEPFHYDRLVHAFGFGVATVACWQALRRHLEPGHPITIGLAVLVMFMGMGVGAINEVVEFGLSRAFSTNVGGYLNTGWDLVFDLIGCTIAAAWVAVRAARIHASAPVAG